MSPAEVLNDIVNGLNDIVLDDENGNQTSLPKYVSVDVISDPDEKGRAELGVQTWDGHRFFVEVQQHD